MSDSTSSAETTPTDSGPAGQYIVVARRYRPQTFDELIGQEHIARALSNAIETNRVGHAYLFTGARGVGKTSAARILAKALNCEHGPTGTPCNQCDICQSISSGDDVDVLEIDGASNRGIDEIRQLRQNAGVRPSRSRLKIYIIDEVHMLTREAFNALLKTLEEPPEHVKFIFCTTEPTKIPITILSRCQRFDFAGILTRSIARRLGQIVDAEGVEADAEALEILARRAAGSMRDSQSLLEQLLAFAPGRITLEDVNGMLGTAADERLAGLVGHLVDRDAAAALADLDAALGEGVGVAQLLEQLFGYFRDCMLAAVDCPAETFLYALPASQAAVGRAGKQLGLTTVLAVMQILEQTLSRLRLSTQGRILAELALVRICNLQDLDEIPELIARLQSCPPTGPAATSHPASGVRRIAAAAAKKDPESPRSQSESYPNLDTSGGASGDLTSLRAAEIWTQALAKMSGIVVDQAKEFDRVEFAEPNRLVISFKAGYAFQKSCCERPDQISRFERALAEVTGRAMRVEFTIQQEPSGGPEPAADRVRSVSPHQRLLEVEKNPMIRRAGELFGAQPTRIEPPKRD